VATRVFVYGAGGHAKVIIDILERMRDVEVAFAVDDAGKGKTLCGYEIIGGRDELLARRGQATTGIVAIGDNKARREASVWLVAQGFVLANAIHPSAVLARGVTIGSGTAIMAGCVINTDTTVGDYAIINTGATVDHDCAIGDGVHIAPGCHLCGGVKIGAGSFLGVGTSVIPKVSIGADATVDAGCTITGNILDGARMRLVPAKSREST